MVMNFDPDAGIRIRNLPDGLIARPEMWISERKRFGYGATAGPLDANDVIGDPISFKYDIWGKALPAMGRIVRIDLIDEANIILTGMTLEFFTEKLTTTPAADAAFTISASNGDAAKHLKDIGVNPLHSIGSAKTFHIEDVDIDYYSPTQEIVLLAWDTGTLTFTAQNLPLVRIYVQPLMRG